MRSLLLLLVLSGCALEEPGWEPRPLTRVDYLFTSRDSPDSVGQRVLAMGGVRLLEEPITLDLLSGPRYSYDQDLEGPDLDDNEIDFLFGPSVSWYGHLSEDESSSLLLQIDLFFNQDLEHQGLIYMSWEKVW